MNAAEKLQNAADLHRAIAIMNELRGDDAQSERDYRNCEFYADEASKARIREGRGI